MPCSSIIQSMGTLWHAQSCVSCVSIGYIGTVAILADPKVVFSQISLTTSKNSNPVSRGIRLGQHDLFDAETRDKSKQIMFRHIAINPATDIHTKLLITREKLGYCITSNSGKFRPIACRLYCTCILRTILRYTTTLIPIGTIEQKLSADTVPSF